MDIKKLIEDVEDISQRYAKNYNINRDSDWFVLKLQEEFGELVQSYLMMIGQGRTKGKSKEELRNHFEAEIADVFCQLLLLSHHHNIDLEKVIKEKWLIWKKQSLP